jgi:hypothetical protein
VIPQRTSNDYSTMGNWSTPWPSWSRARERRFLSATRAAGTSPDCDLLNALANGECGQLTDVNFGKPIASTKTDPDVIQAGTRPNEREHEIGLSHQLLPRVGVDVGYYRRTMTTSRSWTIAPWRRRTTVRSASRRRSIRGCPAAAAT